MPVKAEQCSSKASRNTSSFNTLMFNKNTNNLVCWFFDLLVLEAVDFLYLELLIFMIVDRLRKVVSTICWKPYEPPLL